MNSDSSDPNDPRNRFLFSKCARNHASKSKPNYRPPAHNPPSSPQPPALTRKKTRGRAGFDAHVSREQRQKMYKSSYVPPVGQYNPIRKQHPKLVWDILRTCPKQKKQSQSTPKPAFQSYPQKHQSRQTDKTQLQQSQLQADQQNKVTFTPKDPQIVTQKPCLVDMSRQTGRRNQTSQSSDWGQVDIMKSIRYVKGTLSKNIILGRKTRDKVNRNKLFNTSNYDYDYKVVRQNRNGQADFGRLVGRNQKTKTQNSYSYQHYDYDNYVWQSNSTVFPNTKVLLPNFQKQTDRYRSQQSHVSLAL